MSYTKEEGDIIYKVWAGDVDVEGLVRDWARDRKLDTGSTPEAQMVKLVEELGELARGLCRKDDALIKDSIGDVSVVLIIIAMQLGVDVEGCTTLAYNEIKDRKGEMVNGVFVKEVPKPKPAKINQCDGCQAGLPLDEFGTHKDGQMFGIGCTKHRY